jgi:hypothetical protein
MVRDAARLISDNIEVILIGAPGANMKWSVLRAEALAKTVVGK